MRNFANRGSDMSQLDPLFAPLTIRHVTIRNRFLSTSHAPGYAVHGDITERYVAYEEEKAKGGVGLVQFGGDPQAWRQMHGAAHAWRPARALGRRQLAAGLCAVAAARTVPPFVSRRD